MVTNQMSTNTVMNGGKKKRRKRTSDNAMNDLPEDGKNI